LCIEARINKPGNRKHIFTVAQLEEIAMSQELKQETGQQQEQSKGRIWQWFGVDVSKDFFTATFYNGLSDMGKSEVLNFDSNRKGVRSFLSWRKKHANMVFPSAIVMESTGCYSARLADLMLKLDSSMHVSICNARSVSYYIKSHAANKTDKSDARLIARYGYDFQPPKIKVKSPEEKLLRELVSERGKLVNMVTMLKNKGKTLENKGIKEINESVISHLKEKINELEKKIMDVSKQSDEMNAEIELMTTVPGVARLSAAVIYGTLGSLKQYSRLQLSALSGLYPKISQSGSSPVKSKLSKNGSSYLRQILYLDATQAMAKIPSLRNLRKRLLARENSRKMTARCACMRKLLLIIKGVVDSAIPYDPNFQQKQEIS